MSFDRPTDETTVAFSGIPRRDESESNSSALGSIQQSNLRGQFLQFRGFSTEPNKNGQRKNLSTASLHSSTSSEQEEDHHKETYRERAKHMRDQAKDGAKSFGGLI